MSRQRKRINPAVFTAMAIIAFAASAGCNGSNEPEALPVCSEDEFTALYPKGTIDGIRDRRNEKLGATQQGESIVTVSEPPTGDAWSYRAEHITSVRRLIVEGDYRSDSLIERTIEWNPPQIDQPTLGHEVIDGREAWGDFTLSQRMPLERNTAGTKAWIHCDRGDLAVLAAKDVVFGDTPETRDQSGNRCALETCPLFIIPGSKVRVRDPIESVVHGEKLTTYEIVGFAKDAYHMWRATMTVDEARRLRGATVWNNDTGDIYLKLTAGPEPGRPPITDPTNQPRFTQEPPPPPPTPSTVPPGQRPTPSMVDR